MKLLICFVLLISSAFADVKSRGESIYNNSCVACHNNSTLPAPVLQGQEPGYIVNALKAYKEDLRQDSTMMTMNAVAKNLSLEDMQAVAKYLASENPCDVKIVIDHEREGFIEEFKAGREMMKEKNCMHCHSIFHHEAPRIMGQKETFVKKAITEYRSKKRVNRYMNRFAEKLTDDEINKLTVYISGMRLMRSCEE